MYKDARGPFQERISLENKFSGDYAGHHEAGRASIGPDDYFASVVTLPWSPD
jgi:hypothetical protein